LIEKDSKPLDREAEKMFFGFFYVIYYLFFYKGTYGVAVGGNIKAADTLKKYTLM
jgi:hypothetical protein